MSMTTRGKRRFTRKQKKRIIIESLIIFLACVGAVTILSLAVRGVTAAFSDKELVTEQPPLSVQLLTVNEYSRPGLALEKVNAIVIHYTANPGTGARANRNYFESLKDSHKTKASSHFIVGLEGEIVQCIPTAEISYASNDRNFDTISIECCHPDADGKFRQATYDALVEMTAWLCGKFHLSPQEDIIRHYDITGKACPKYYVEHTDAWEKFLKDVEHYIKRNGVERKIAETGQE